MSSTKLTDAYTTGEIVKSLISGFIFSTLIAAPVVAVLINWMLLYVYHVYIYATLLVFTASLWTGAWLYFYYKTLSMYRVYENIDLHRRFKREALVAASIVVVAGIIAMIILVPRLT